MSRRARVALAVVGAVLLVVAVWTLLNPLTSTNTTTEQTPGTAVPATPGAVQVTKTTTEESQTRPDTLVAAVAALGIVLVATATFPGLKFGLGGASAEVLAKETASTTMSQVDHLQSQVDNVSRQLRVAVERLQAQIDHVETQTRRSPTE